MRAADFLMWHDIYYNVWSYLSHIAYILRRKYFSRILTGCHNVSCNCKFEKKSHRHFIWFTIAGQNITDKWFAASTIVYRPDNNGNFKKNVIDPLFIFYVYKCIYNKCIEAHSTLKYMVLFSWFYSIGLLHKCLDVNLRYFHQFLDIVCHTVRIRDCKFGIRYLESIFRILIPI